MFLQNCVNKSTDAVQIHSKAPTKLFKSSLIKLFLYSRIYAQLFSSQNSFQIAIKVILKFINLKSLSM